MVSKIQSFLEKRNLSFIYDITIFIIALFGFHYLWKYWESAWGFRFFSDQSILEPLFNILTTMVFNTSDLILKIVLNGNYTIVDKTWYFDSGGFIEIVDGCSGLKATLQFITIILLTRGNWKEKMWFIPVGIIILFMANITRILGLNLIVYYDHSSYQFTHDYIFRPFFYGVIFLLWVIFIEKIRNRRLM